MDEYKKGFLEALQAVCYLGDAAWDRHFHNAQDETLGQFGRSAALSCAVCLGQFISGVKETACSVYHGDLDPRKIAEANGERYWWATEDGKGIS